MENKIESFGTSLLVPSVQELVKNKHSDIPDRYIRHNQVEDELIVSVQNDDEIPVIDFSRLVSEPSELAKLHDACMHWGFFQLVNHGVTVVDKIKEEVKELFNLPMEEKKRYWQYPGEVEGFGQAFVVSEEQKLDWGDMFFMVTQPSHARKPHLFPNLPLPLRESLDKYSIELKNLSMKILSSMAKALEIDDEEEITGIFEDGHQSMRMNYYPPCPQPHKVIGLTPHSDASALTILLQVNEVEGLQIKKNGKWVSVNPLPNAFVINIGDILEIMTNGIYRSIEHRATVNTEKERMSIATFYAPKYEAEMGAAPSLISHENPCLFRRIGVEEYYKTLFARELHSKSFLDTLRL
ncbi:2-oxoglutarate (2OG) and Fe(II)-dependent oxygenase superfamily protein [Euphorbia peplus]|nr:2-oxoglutarate (2OG) and Fe(II)-dependent oxygenase superfamily protein [Euphorbia peplus]